MKTRFSKTLLVLAVSSLLGAGTALAGQGPGDCDQNGDGTCSGEGNGGGNGGGQRNRGGPAEHLAAMANRLGLTLEQQVRLLGVLDGHAQDRKQLRQQIFDDYGGEMCAMRATHRAEILAELTEEQRALHEQNRQRRAGHGSRGGFGGDFECPEPADG